MATKRATNKVKATVWTTDVRAEFEATRQGAIYLIFRTLNSKEQRAEVLNGLQQADAEMTERERQTAGMPDCPKCGNNRQVWRNQISGRITCHRAFCDTVIDGSEGSAA